MDILNPSSGAAPHVQNGGPRSRPVPFSEDTATEVRKNANDIAASLNEPSQRGEQSQYALHASLHDCTSTSLATVQQLGNHNPAEVRGQLLELDEKVNHLALTIEQHVGSQEPSRAAQLLKSVVTVAAIAVVAAVAVGALASPVGLVVGAVGLAYLMCNYSSAAGHADEASRHFNATPWKNELSTLKSTLDTLRRRIDELEREPVRNERTPLHSGSHERRVGTIPLTQKPRTDPPMNILSAKKTSTHESVQRGSSIARISVNSEPEHAYRSTVRPDLPQGKGGKDDMVIEMDDFSRLEHD